MLIKATDTTGYDVQASDGTLGKVVDLLFDDARWTVRWLVVETGNWWADHRVLIPALALALFRHIGMHLPGQPDDGAGRCRPAGGHPPPASGQFESAGQRRLRL